MIKSFLTLVFATLLFSVSGYAQDNPTQEIPEQIKSFVTQHFSSLQIAEIKYDSTDNSDAYEVKLSDETTIDFSKTFEPTEIVSKTKLPESVLPLKVLAYVKEKYSSNNVMEWEAEDNGQKIKLDNGVKLLFDKDGTFVKVDD